MRSLPPFHDTASYVFQRLEPVKEQLAMVQLPPVLDAACKAWYVHRTATALAPHLLELYRRQIEEAVIMQGLDALIPAARPLLQIITEPSMVAAQLAWSPTAVEVVSTALAQELAASDDASGWSTMARRVAIDLVAGALETLTQEHGKHTLTTMPDPVFETAVLQTAIALDPLAFRDRVHQCLARLAGRVPVCCG